MTGIDLIVALMLQTCNPTPSMPSKEKPNVEVVWYECPLLGSDAEFLVWYRVCPRPERYAIAMRDMRSGKGFIHNQFGEVDPSYVEVYAMPVYMPNCRLEEDK